MSAESFTPAQGSGTDGEAVALPIEGVLDLHTFQPCDVAAVVADYLALCQEKGILEVRVIHGKGIGNLRRTVHALLPRLSIVRSFSIAGEHYGGQGATLVHLHPVTPAAIQTGSATFP